MSSAALAATAHVGEPVMGTVLEVSVVADSGDAARELANGAIGVARHWDDVLTTWRPDGELERLNAQAGRGPTAVSPDLSRALARMVDLSRATNGAFDPAVGTIVEALRSGTAPEAAARKRAHIGGALALTASTATLTANVRLDAGGIGKGIALDAVADYLNGHGARDWFLDFGGSSQLASGTPETAAAWNVLIAGERPGTVHGTLALRGNSLSTSRALEAFDPAGAIVDPRTGAPVAAPRLATVLAKDATAADAWSTALIVLGRTGLAAAQTAGIAALFEDADGVVTTHDFPLAPVSRR